MGQVKPSIVVIVTGSDSNYIAQQAIAQLAIKVKTKLEKSVGKI